MEQDVKISSEVEATRFQKPFWKWQLLNIYRGRNWDTYQITNFWLICHSYLKFNLHFIFLNFTNSFYFIILYFIYPHVYFLYSSFLLENHFFSFEALLSEIVLWKSLKVCLRVFLFETMLISPSYWEESCAAYQWFSLGCYC